jgi:hypothetical protein
VFNAGKEIEAMKHLMLHHIASSLYCFIASIAQLCPLGCLFLNSVLILQFR